MIYVVGSLNADYVVPVERIPQAGETLSGGDLTVYPGGKGANQAVAAARLGGQVKMIGQIGNDASGRLLKDSLIDAGVGVSGVEESPGASGSALIFVLPSGDNSIVVSPAANAKLTARAVRERLAQLTARDFVLCQLESPLDAVSKALSVAKEAGATTILDPAPARALGAEILSNVDILTPNETEAAELLRSPVGGVDPGGLRKLGPGSVILKRGERGCLIVDGDSETAVPAYKVEAVDTTAAGDTFNAGLAVGLGRGMKLEAACRWATAAAAISVTRPGAQTSAPNAEEVEQFLAHRV